MKKFVLVCSPETVQGVAVAGSRTVACTRCNTSVWLSPANFQFEGLATILCVPCAVHRARNEILETGKVPHAYVTQATVDEIRTIDPEAADIAQTLVPDIKTGTEN